MAISRSLLVAGQPKTIWSDNGTNFVGADHELQRLVSEWNQQKLHDDLAARGITWKFNPPAAPHHGGAWERLVRSCKKAMYAVLGYRNLTDEILATALCLVSKP